MWGNNAAINLRNTGADPSKNLCVAVLQSGSKLRLTRTAASNHASQQELRASHIVMLGAAPPQLHLRHSEADAAEQAPSSALRSAVSDGGACAASAWLQARCRNEDKTKVE
jgi:hypothetical protein